MVRFVEGAFGAGFRKKEFDNECPQINWNFKFETKIQQPDFTLWFIEV